MSVEQTLDLGEVLFGNPPQRLLDWLDDFIEDQDAAGARAWMPWTKRRYRHRREALDMARTLVFQARYARDGNPSGLPWRLEPPRGGHSDLPQMGEAGF